MAIGNMFNMKRIMIFEILLDETEYDDVFNEHFNNHNLLRLLLSRDRVPKINYYMEVVQLMERIEHIDDFKFHYGMCRQFFKVEK